MYHSAVVADWRQRDRLLRDAGIELALVSPRRWHEGGRTVVLDDRDSFVVPAFTAGHHPYRFAYDPFALVKAITRDLDVIDVHEEPASLAAAEVLLVRWLRRAGSVPIVFYSAQNIHKRYPPPFRWFEHRFLRAASAAYVCNSEAVDVLRRKGFTGPVEVIPLGIDTELFDPAPPANAVREHHPALAIGYVGRLESHKGVSVLLQAMRRLPNARLDVVGDGPQRAELQAESEQLGITDRVRFVGRAERDSLAALYRGFDVLAVPSLTTEEWKEQFGRVVAEAMSVGTPVVASSSGSLPEVVGPGGLLVPPGDADALADALAQLEDPIRRASLSRAAAAWATRFRWEAVAAQHERLYRRVAVEASA